MCDHLNINSANLFHVEATSRLLDILKEFEKSSDHDISVRELHEIFRAVGNENSAARLLRVARTHLVLNSKPSGKGRHRNPHKVKDLYNDEVSDLDLDDNLSSEDAMIV